MYNRGYIMNLDIPIYFECANEADVTIQLNGSVHIQNCKYEYSFDMNEWHEYKVTTHSYGIVLHPKEKLYFRGSRLEQNEDAYLHFVIDGKVYVDGNINSLLSPDPNIYPNINNLNEYGKYTYYKLFHKCDDLLNAPEIEHNKYLADYCYAHMFDGCSNITECPKLGDDIKLAEYCYNSMFEGCTKITKCPELNNCELAIGCYSYMFKDCTSITCPPKLPAQELTISCYAGMFQGCTSLEKCPCLCAPKLHFGCYQAMFANCTSLKESPKLCADELEPYCYNSMFINCVNLNKVKCFPHNICPCNSTHHWLYNVAPTGKFYTYKSTKWKIDSPCGIPWNWKRYNSTCKNLCENNSHDNTHDYIPKPYIPLPPAKFDLHTPVLDPIDHAVDVPIYQDKTPLHFINIGDKDCNIELTSYCINNINPQYEYKINDGEWLKYKVYNSYNIMYPNGCQDHNPIILHPNDTLYFRGSRLDQTDKSYLYFIMQDDSSIEVHGNIHSLLKPDEFYYITDLNDYGIYTFYSLFYHCKSLINAPQLYAHILSPSCYEKMFIGCDGIENSPMIHTLKLAPSCYRDMFIYCDKLTNTPLLSTSKLEPSCYYRMFYECTSLKEIKLSFDDNDKYIKNNYCLDNFIHDINDNGIVYSTLECIPRLKSLFNDEIPSWEYKVLT